MRKPRSRMTIKQVKYLVDRITIHIENHPDDIGRWLVALKYAYRVFVTLDNMGIYEETHSETVIQMDAMFEQLRNEFARHDIFTPEPAVYYNK